MPVTASLGRLFAFTSLMSLCAIACGSADQTTPGVPVANGDGGAASSSTASTASAGGTDPGPMICPDASDVFEVEPAASNLLFVLDRSGSMHLRVDEQNTRWMLTKAGLERIVANLPTDAVTGLAMFPSGDQPISCCTITTGNYITCDCADGELPGPEQRCDGESYDQFAVDMALHGPSQASDIMAAVSASDDEFYWGTPLAPALAGTLEKVSTLSLDGVTSVVLLTDGLPTSCHTSEDPDANDITHAIDAVTAGLGQGVRTYVVGIDAAAVSSDPATDLAVNLSRLAEAAGTGKTADCGMDDSCAYVVNADNFDSALSSALESIALDAMSCTFELPLPTEGTPDYDAVNITVSSEGQTHTIGRDVAHQNGWDYLPSKSKIQLYGEACDLLKSNAAATVQVVVGCKTIEG